MMQRAIEADTIRKAPVKPTCFQAFIAVSGEQDVKELRRCGVMVDGVFDGFVTARIPADVMHSSMMPQGVTHIALAHPLTLHNDSARFLTAVDQVHLAANLVAPLTGKGVIVGVVDVGVDFNHINFRDKDGRSRLLAVYMPHDSTGMRPVVQGDTLPGSCYETPEAISLLTTDYTGSSHGTHTTGTAAGGFMDNGWHGMAPEADIVVCAMPDDELTDVNVANAVKYIMDFADRAGKPCVVNMSIGDNSGPNDGTSFLCKVFESLSGPGHICVLSAGNDGNEPVCFHYSLTHERDTVTTLFRKQLTGISYSGYVSMWSDRNQIHRSRIVVVNQDTHEIEYASPVVDYMPEDSVFTVSSETDSLFAAFFTGSISAANAMEPRRKENGGTTFRYHTLWQIDAKANDDIHLMGVQYFSDSYINLTGWATKGIAFHSHGIQGVTGGSTYGSISDLATTDSVISVGAYCSRDSYIDKDGHSHHLANCHPNDIAYFSSFGPDENGKSRPDVCAPGMALISSANRYNDVANRTNWPAPVVVDGVEYPYYANQGTSMSTPVVTGTIALLLQVNPSLSVSAVREIFERSSLRDSYVIQGDPARWGSGKLNAQAAVEDVISNTLLPGDVNRDDVVNISDIRWVIEMILRDSSHFDSASLMRADVNRDGGISISDINRIIDLILKND